MRHLRIRVRSAAGQVVAGVVAAQIVGCQPGMRLEWAALRMHRAGASAAAAAGLAVVAVAPAPGSWGQPPNILLELSSGLLQRLEKGKSLEKK